MSVGRIVHYVMPNGQHRAAMVINVDPSDPRPDLRVFTHPMDGLEYSNGMLFVEKVPMSEGDVGTYHWPEKV